MTDIITFTTPVGRLVAGDVYKGQDKDASGNPLVIKSGPNAGQPTVKFYIGVAIQKTPNVPWESEDWGMKIMQVAKATMPSLFDPQTGVILPGRNFAFKVTDGDSTIPNTVNKRPCDSEGFPGHWVLHFSNGYAPKCYTADGTSPLLEQMIKRGYYIQVNATVNGNSNAQNPGVFLNQNLIAFSGYGDEIQGGADPRSVGFGGGPAPAGMSTTPPAGMTPAPVAAPPVAPAPVAAPPVAPAPVAAPPVAPAPVAAPPVAPPPATDLIQENNYNYNGHVYSHTELIAQGWTEDLIATLPRA